jgi:hypothetical protein
MRRHLFNLLKDSWTSLVGALGTTTLAILVAIITFVFVLALHIAFQRRRQGWKELKGNFNRNIKNALVPTIGANLIIWGILFGFFLVKAVYHDHQLLVAKAASLRAENENLRTDITNKNSIIDSLGAEISQRPSRPPTMAEASTVSDNAEFIVERAEIKQKQGRANVAKQLNLLIEEGKKLQSELVNARTSDSIADSLVADWNSKTRQFIFEHMGTEYRNRFGDDTKIPAESPLAVPNSEVKRQLWLALYHRIFRLNEFVEQLKK